MKAPVVEKGKGATPHDAPDFLNFGNNNNNNNSQGNGNSDDPFGAPTPVPSSARVVDDPFAVNPSPLPSSNAPAQQQSKSLMSLDIFASPSNHVDLLGVTEKKQTDNEFDNAFKSDNSSNNNNNNSNNNNNNNSSLNLLAPALSPSSFSSYLPQYNPSAPLTHSILTHCIQEYLTLLSSTHHLSLSALRNYTNAAMDAVTKSHNSNNSNLHNNTNNNNNSNSNSNNMHTINSNSNNHNSNHNHDTNLLSGFGLSPPLSSVAPPNNNNNSNSNFGLDSLVSNVFTETSPASSPGPSTEDNGNPFSDDDDNTASTGPTTAIGAFPISPLSAPVIPQQNRMPPPINFVYPPNPSQFGMYGDMNNLNNLNNLNVNVGMIPVYTPPIVQMQSIPIPQAKPKVHITVFLSFSNLRFLCL